MWIAIGDGGRLGWRLRREPRRFSICAPERETWRWLTIASPRAGRRLSAPISATKCSFELSKKTKRRQAGDRIRFLEADAQQLPFADGQFQITTVAFGLRNVTDTDLGLSEIARVTRAGGGKVAILEFSQPRGRLFGPLFRFYSNWILPSIGQLVSRSKDDAYRYLPASVREFPDGQALADRLRLHGLIDVRWYPLTFGIATLYLATKSLSASQPFSRDAAAERA